MGKDFFQFSIEAVKIEMYITRALSLVLPHGNNDECLISDSVNSDEEARACEQAQKSSYPQSHTTTLGDPSCGNKTAIPSFPIASLRSAT
jgi:hypothetical protein